MKKTVLFLTCLVMSLLVTSCSKDDDYAGFTGDYSFKTSGTVVVKSNAQDLQINDSTTLHINGITETLDMINQVGQMKISKKDGKCFVFKNVIMGKQYLYYGKVNNDSIYFDKFLVTKNTIAVSDLKDTYYTINGVTVPINSITLQIELYSQGVGYNLDNMLIIDENYTGSVNVIVNVSTQMGDINVPVSMGTVIESDVSTVAQKN